MTKLTYTLLLTLLVYFLAIWLLKDDEPVQADQHDYRIYKPIAVENPDSLSMMLYCRDTPESLDSLFRIRVGL